MAAGTMITLKAADGHALGAYKAAPAGTAKGAVVILQEIFGVTGHIRAVADGYAAAGYLAVAPALFDRVKKNVELPYSAVPEGRELVGKVDQAMLLADLAAATDAARAAGHVVHIGYCWGGALAYLAACKTEGVAGAVNYYGSRTVQLCEAMQPRVPVMYHFGALDKTLPPEGVAKIKAAHPAGIYHVYENADHGFNCDERAQFDAGAAALARARTLKFLDDVMQ